MKNQIIVAAALAAMTLATSCRHHDAWSVSGEVAGISDRTLVVEAFNNGRWYVVDSVKTSNGSFEYVADAPAQYPEVMRLGMDGRYIYFPVDSIDHVSIIADSARFDTDYRLDGTLQARTIQTIDSVINSSVASRGELVTIGDTDLKHQLFTIAYEDPSVMSVYYLINKTVGNRPLYDITGSGSDRRLYGAVAQRFSNERPDDPRTKYLAETFHKARMAAGDVQGRSIEAAEVGLIDIERYDAKGQLQSLADMASKGGVTLLSFTAYGIPASPAYTAILNGLYDKYHAAGLNIYQIGFDSDESTWKENARNMPWTTVWNSTTDGDEALSKYNVGALPTTFVIDRSGVIRERVADPAELEKAVQKWM